MWEEGAPQVGTKFCLARDDDKRLKLLEYCVLVLVLDQIQHTVFPDVAGTTTLWGRAWYHCQLVPSTGAVN